MKILQFLVITLLFITSNVISAQEKNVEPEFIEYYFTNKSHEKVEDVTLDMKKIYLVIVTKNAVGEVINLQMDEIESDYIYKNELLGSKQPIKIKVTSDITKMKLVLFNKHKKKHQKIKAKSNNSKTNKNE